MMFRWAMLAFASLLISSTAAQSPHSHRHGFGDAEKWAQVFDDPERDAWQKPHEVIEALALKPGATVADIGAGTGYFAARLARMLPQGARSGRSARGSPISSPSPPRRAMRA